MVSISSYLNLAEYAYERGHGPASTINGFVVVSQERASSLGNGFQGVVHEGQDEVVVAFSGTLGGVTNAPISQTSANLRIGLHIIPNMAGSAKRLVKSAGRLAKPMSIVGHSLGGALAQVVGVWTGIPFICFNGPGMGNHLRWSAFNVLHPRQMRRTLKAASFTQATGICFSVAGDFVGNFGTHVGMFEEVESVGRNSESHDLNAIRNGLDGLVLREPSHWLPGFYHQHPAALPPQLGDIDLGGSFGGDLLGRFT